jgi:MoaA/NifB/PqqE/SkfB family radical SAM enzyme
MTLIREKLRRETAKNILSHALMLLAHSPQGNYRRLIGVFARIAKTEHQKMIANWAGNWLSQGNPGSLFLNRALKRLHPNVRKNFIANAIVNLFFRDQKVYDRLRAEYGFNPPSVMLLSPTMRCNYHCVGCYAGNYTRDDDLPPEVFDRVLTEAEAIGIKFVTILGGEPFIYPPLLDIFAAHKNVSFQVYTNGSLIDEDMAARLVELGNVAPQVSIDGFREQTDAGRGQGAFDRAIKAMDNLRQEGCIFGFSTTVTPDNIDVITSDEFIDFIIDKGALYGWYFLYMPVGREPSLERMPSPEQRNKLRLAILRFRRTKPILLVDFWNDGPLTAGCISGGRIYFHINHKGDVEPCIFVHFATDNIKQTPLVEALNSPFFRGLRKMQPFSYNTLRPCPIIDHPQIMRMALKKWGAYPTHEGAEKTFTELSDGLDEYATEIKELYKSIWEQDYTWAEKWMTVMDHPPERIKTRKAGYQLSQRRRGRD